MNTSISSLKNLSSSLYKITKIYNNINFYNKNIPTNVNYANNVKKNLKRIYKIDIINKNYNLKFYINKYNNKILFFYIFTFLQETHK